MATFNLLLALLSSGCLPGLLCVGGLLMAFAGCWALRREFFINKHGVIVPGTIIAIDRRRGRGRGKPIVYDNTVRFQRHDADEPDIFVVNTGSFKVYQVNQQVSVIYVPTNRELTRIVGRQRWVASWLVIGISLIFTAMTVAFYLSMVTIHYR